VLDAYRRLEDRLGRRPTVAEVAAELGLNEELITDILRRTSGLSGPTASAWKTDGPNVAPTAVTLRAIQAQLADLCERLTILVDHLERQDGL
jgi:DNA-directed RNA polymerase specialized sigma subunit